jgi:hypothetical protein
MLKKFKKTLKIFIFKKNIKSFSLTTKNLFAKKKEESEAPAKDTKAKPAAGKDKKEEKKEEPEFDEDDEKFRRRQAMADVDSIDPKYVPPEIIQQRIRKHLKGLVQPGSKGYGLEGHVLVGLSIVKGETGYFIV